MGSRSFGELLLRRPSPIARTPLCQIRRTPASWPARSISNTPQAAAQPRGKEDDYDYLSQVQQEAASVPRPRPPPPPPQQQQQRPPPSSPRTTTQEIDSLMGLSSRRAGPPLPSPRGQFTSSDEVRAARNAKLFGANFSDPNSPNRRMMRSPPKLHFDDLSMPAEWLDPNQANKPSEAANLAAQQQETFANYPRLNPTYGRVVELDVSRGRDIVRGIGMLGSLVTRNKVKHESYRQKYHERGGLRRKRLASERWRARFKKGFKDVTRRVSELTAKGW